MVGSISALGTHKLMIFRSHQINLSHITLKTPNFKIKEDEQVTLRTLCAEGHDHDNRENYKIKSIILIRFFSRISEEDMFVVEILTVTSSSTSCLYDFAISGMYLDINPKAMVYQTVHSKQIINLHHYTNIHPLIFEKVNFKNMRYRTKRLQTLQ
ncbi:hypothetical protein QTP88_009357 [Uroleucon formosanum]